MGITDLLNKRILVSEKTTSYGSASIVVEIKVLEISPSGKWVKTQNMNGNKFWKSCSEINLIEVLSFEGMDKPKDL